MEITAAAAQATAYTTARPFAEQINDYLATTKTSIATLASEIPGYSARRSPRYLSGKWGDIPPLKAPRGLAGRAHREAVALPEPGRKTGTEARLL